MDFHSLSRKELQALCKKNKIPANMTNIAMANALADLPQVSNRSFFFLLIFCLTIPSYLFRFAFQRSNGYVYSWPLVFHFGLA